MIVATMLPLAAAIAPGLDVHSGAIAGPVHARCECDLVDAGWHAAQRDRIRRRGPSRSRRVTRVL